MEYHFDYNLTNGDNIAIFDIECKAFISCGFDMTEVKHDWYISDVQIWNCDEWVSVEDELDFALKTRLTEHAFKFHKNKISELWNQQEAA